jgi:hypothetical protein
MLDQVSEDGVTLEDRSLPILGAPFAHLEVRYQPLDRTQQLAVQMLDTIVMSPLTRICVNECHDQLLKDRRPSAILDFIYSRVTFSLASKEPTQHW